MLGIPVISILALASVALCDPGKDMMKKEMMMKMMPPLSVNCNQNLVTSWISNIDRDNAAWFEEKAKEHREGKDYFNSYSELRAGLENNICLIRQLAARPNKPTYCSGYTEEELIGCPDLENMDMDDIKERMKGKMCNKDIRKMLCKVDRKIAHKVEGMIIKDFMEWTECSQLTNPPLSSTFSQFWNNPQTWMSSQMNSAPTLEKIKMFKSCLAEYAVDNLGFRCSSLVTPSERQTIQSRLTVPTQEQLQQLWDQKKALLEQTEQTDVKKYLCLLYYKIRADRSNTLNIDYDKGAKEYFKEEFGEALKDIKETLLWQMASTTNVPQTVRNDGDAIRAGTYDPQPPTWEQEGRRPTFQEWRANMQTKLMTVYYVYNAANQNSFAGSQLSQALQNMYNSMDLNADYAENLKTIWETNSVTAAGAIDMIKAKVETIAQLMGETDQKVKLEAFKKMLMKYMMKEKMEEFITNPDCSSISSLVQYSTVANNIVNRNWQQLESMNWPQDINKMQMKKIKFCIVNDVYNRLQSTCSSGAYSARRNVLTQLIQTLENDPSVDKRQKKMMIKTKLMQNRNMNSGPSVYCDLYFLVSASSMEEMKKKMHFGEELMELKKELMEYDSLVAQNPSACSDASKQAAFDKVSMVMKKSMMKALDMDDDMDGMDDFMDGDEDEDEDDEDEDEYDGDDDDDGEDDEEDEMQEFVGFMQRLRGMRGGQGGMRGGRGMMRGGRGMMRGGRMGGRSGEDEDEEREGGRHGGMMKKIMKMKMMKKMMGKKMKMCPSMRRFKTCTSKLICTVFNEKLGSMNCQAAGNYSTMVSNLDSMWTNIENNLNAGQDSTFMEDFSEFIQQVEQYDPVFGPCVMKKVTEKLSDYWAIDECAAMHYAMKYKMKAKMMDWRDGEESEEEYTNQGQGQGSMPQPQTNGQGQGGRFSFNQWRNHMQGGQWNRQGRGGRGRGSK